MKSKIFFFFLFAHCSLFAGPTPKSVIARRQQQQKQKTARTHEQQRMQPSRAEKKPLPTSKANPRRKKTTPSSVAPAPLPSTFFHEAYSCSIPTAWQCIQDKQQLPEKVDAVFIGTGRGGLTPTIHIAQETTPKTISEYIEEVLAYHKHSDTTLESTVFTQLPARNCHFYVLKTEKHTSWGRVFCLQAITIVNHVAYIFTSNSTQEDYPDISLLFLKTVSSFQITEKDDSGTAILENALKALQEEQQGSSS